MASLSRSDHVPPRPPLCRRYIDISSPVQIVAFLSTSEDLRVSTAQLMATRMFITCICGWMVLKIQGDPNPILGPPEVRFWLAFRGVIGFLGIASNYYALAYLTVSEVTSTGFLVPLTTGLPANHEERSLFTSTAQASLLHLFLKSRTGRSKHWLPLFLFSLSCLLPNPLSFSIHPLQILVLLPATRSPKRNA